MDRTVTRPHRTPLTQQEIADLFGVTRAAVYLVERGALAKLHRHPNTAGVLRRLAEECGIVREDRR